MKPSRWIALALFATYIVVGALTSATPAGATAIDLGTPTASCTIYAPAGTYSINTALTNWSVQCQSIPPNVGMIVGFDPAAFANNGNAASQGILFRLMDNNGGALPPSLTLVCTTASCSSGTDENGLQVVNQANAEYESTDSPYSTENLTTNSLVLYAPGAESSSSTNEDTCNAGASYNCGTVYSFADNIGPSAVIGTTGNTLGPGLAYLGFTLISLALLAVLIRWMFAFLKGRSVG